MRVVLLSGGVGGAKLALGFYHALPPGRLSVVANTGDDLELQGLRVCPDLDILLYTLAGRVNPRTGWGLSGDSFHALEMLEELGEPGWFRLGDRDLAVSLLRTRLLAEGWRLTDVSLLLADRMGLAAALLPMTDAWVQTVVHTAEGERSFQEYFVRQGWQPRVLAVEFRGAASSRVTPEVRAALAQCRLAVIAPSNPYLSVDPILSVPGLREALRSSPALKLAVSPIVGGRALKGPAAKIMAELGHQPSAATVAAHYRGLVDLFILDQADAGLAGRIKEMAVRPLPTVMETLEDKVALARALLALAQEEAHAPG